MRIEQDATGGDIVRVSLDDAEADAMRGRWDAVMAWAEGLPPSGGRPSIVSGGTGKDDRSYATFVGRAPALAFLAGFVPGGIAEAARALGAVAGNHHEVEERDGAVTVSIRHDRNGKTRDATWPAYDAYAEAARAAGFEPELVHADRDTAEVRLVPVPMAPAPASSTRR